MNIYFDTEFTGLVPGTTLISIGMVTDTDEKFYAEFTDYDKTLCDDWIKENVISHLRIFNKIPDKEFNEKFVYGNSAYIKTKLAEWLDDVSKGERIQLVGDVCHYDMTLLCNLFGGAFDLPSNVNPVCYDICQDLWAFLDDDYNDLTTSMEKSFNVSREELLESINLDDQDNKPKGKKHTALYDAEVIKYLYKTFTGD